MSEFFGKLASFHFNADISEIEYYCMERLSKRFNNIFPFIGEEDHFLEKYTPISKDIPDKFDFFMGPWADGSQKTRLLTYGN